MAPERGQTSRAPAALPCPTQPAMSASSEHSAKRRRAEGLGLLSTPPPPLPDADFLPPPAGEQAQPRAGSDEPGGKPDVFAFFAERASKQRELEMEVQRLQQREAQLSNRVQEAELEASRLRDAATAASARQQAREAQLELQLQEQQEALRLEVERAAGLSSQLRAAAAAAEAADQRAAAAAAEADEAAQHAAGAAGSSPASTELQLQVSQLSMQLEQLAADKEEAERRAEVALATAQQRGEAEAAAARLLQQQLEEAVGLAEAASSEKHALEAALAAKDRQLVLAEAQLEGAKSSGGDAVLVKSLRDQLREQEALVAEARRLKEQAT